MLCRGRDRGFVLYFPLFLRVLGWLVGGCLYTRVHTHKLLGYLMSAKGVRRTPGAPEESRSTRAQYIRRPYNSAKYICLYIYWATGFADLG